MPVAVLYSYIIYIYFFKVFSHCSPFGLYAPALLGAWHFLATAANISANFAKYRHLKEIYGFLPFSCKRTIFICFLATFFVNIFLFVFFLTVLHSSVANAKIHKSPKTSSFQPHHDPKPQLFYFRKAKLLKNFLLRTSDSFRISI